MVDDKNNKNQGHKPSQPDGDIDLWQYVTKTVRPLETPSDLYSALDALELEIDGRVTAQDAQSGDTGDNKTDLTNICIPLQDKAAVKPAPKIGSGIDRTTERRLNRAKIEPEATIDLHGHTLDQAYHMARDFIIKQSHAGRRVLLVITGKGQWNAGVIKRSFPEWLHQPPLCHIVLHYQDAHIRHGGAGAVYVLLRKKK